MIEEFAKRAEKYNIYRIAVMHDGIIEEKELIPSCLSHCCYSVAKLFCTVAVGILFDRGLLTPADTLVELIPDLLQPSRANGVDKITLHQLLTHTAGLDYNLDIDCIDTEFLPTDYLSHILSHPLISERKYTDSAFYIVSRIITEKAGVECAQFIRENIANKLHFSQFAFATCPMGYAIGGSGLFCEARDVAKLGYTLANGGAYDGKQIVSQKWVGLMIQNEYEFHNLGNGWYGKGGMNGQYCAANIQSKISVAWHGHEQNYDKKEILGV